MKVLVVAAHPDDEVLGLGGSLLRHQVAGDQVAVHIACTGSNLRYGPEEAGALLEASRQVATRLGATLTFGGLPDQGVDTLSLVQVVEPIEQLLEEFRPEILYIHHGGDANRDHRLLAEAALVAARPFAASSIRRVFAFETPSSTEWHGGIGHAFTPTRFVDVSSTIEEKLDIFSLYASEVRPEPHPRSISALRARAAYWGSTAGVPHAEPFVVLRELE